MISNTATPRYYGRFRDKVLRGEIPVCREISMQMNRIDQKIADPRYYYDPAPVEGFIAFCECELTLTDGSDLHLLESFKLWAEEIYGWYIYVTRDVYEPGPDNHGGHYVKKRIKERLCKKLYLIVGRGAAKSLFMSCVQAYEENVNWSTTYQMTTAPTMKQADEVMSPIRTALVISRGPMFKFLTFGSINNTTGSKYNQVKLASTKKGIENRLTGSLIEVRPMSVDKLQGMRPNVATIDEWLSGDIREDVVGAIEQGCSKNEDYLIIAASSEGNVRNGPGDTIKLELTDILKGEYYAPHVSIWWYKLDDISEVEYPELWVKANPNLGYSVKYEAYQLDKERAEKAPATKNDILAKRFGLPLEGFTYFFTYEETELHRRRDFWRMPCSMGCDLSRGDDFCAFTFLFPLRGEQFGVKSRCYISEATMIKLPASMREKYEEFLAEGSLSVMDGTVLDMAKVYEDLIQYIDDNQYEVRTVGYDPYNAREFIELWTKDNADYAVEKVIQGAKTESVPLGELKKLAEDRLLIFDQEIIKFTMGNCVAQIDTNGNRKLTKPRNEQKIDSIAALLDAFVLYKLYKDEFE